MSFRTALWKVNREQLEPVDQVRLDQERRLEDWIVRDPSFLGRDLLVVGRQIRTAGGPLDILALDPEGGLVVVELKRDRTPREVVAQVLDYASWVHRLTYEELEDLYRDRNDGASLPDAFRERFEAPIPESTPSGHSLLVVSAELDDSSERIIEYLQDVHSIDINAVFFNVFRVDGVEILARSWLADPEETTERQKSARKRPWSGLWFVNVSADEDHRDWGSMRELGYVSAGGDRRYWGGLEHLNVGDPVAAYQRKRGYVGYGIVSRRMEPVSTFKLSDGRVLAEVEPRLNRFANNPDRQERAVGIQWKKTFDLEEARTFVGVFANQNVVCKLRQPATVEFLTKEFGISADESAAT